VVLSNVDILALYAVCGFFAIPLLRLPTAVLAIGGLAALYLPPVFSGWSLPPAPDLRAHAANATRIYGLGSFGAILEFRWRETQELIVPLLTGVAQKGFGLMLLGVAVWRAGVIQEPKRYRSLLWAVCLGAGIIGIVNTTADVLAHSFSRLVHVARIFQALGSDVPLALAYVAGLLAWRRSERATAFLAPIAAAGRMALTNHLTQSLVFALLFYGYGFHLFGRSDPKTAAAFGVGAQLWFSVWWLNHYRFGPFEWLWGSMTYGRRQPMRVLHAVPAFGNPVMPPH
jgi:uncharacterized protein